MDFNSLVASAPAKLAPLTGNFGAAIEVAPGTDFANGQWPEFLVRALDQFRVLVLRGNHSITPQDLLAIGRAFGTPETYHPIHQNLEGAPGVMVLKSNSADHPLNDNWHTDGSTRPDPCCISVLQAVSIPDFGRDTVFADMESAFYALSEPMQEFLKELTAVHSWGPERPHIAPVDHPVVLTDPVSGRHALYVNKLYTRFIKGLRPDESQALLEFLYAQTKFHEFLLRVTWQKGTVVIWDNRKTQHYLVLDRPYPRVMHRVVAFPHSESAVQLGTEQKLFIQQASA